jgi:peptidoglycan hydrolase CwlO-like protein
MKRVGDLFMFDWFRRKKTLPEDVIVSAVVTQTAALINDLHHRMDLRFKELNSQLREVELTIVQLENKLLAKDLKDKQAYGLLHYKLHEAKNPKLTEEISELEENLRLRKALLKDQ